MGTYPQRLLTDDETVLLQFHPHWKTLIAPAVVVSAAIAGAATLWSVWPADVAGRVAVVAGVLLVGAATAGWQVAVWWHTSYVLTTERLIVRSGVVARRGQEIPLEQINTVSFTQGVGERLLGFGDVEVDSASNAEPSRFDNVPDPEGLQRVVIAAREARTDRHMPSAGQTAGWPHVPTPQPPGPSGHDDTFGRLDRLVSMREQGTISDAQFTRLRDELLGP